MKRFFDQNLSFKLSPILDSVFAGSKHVKDFGLTGNDDEAIWQLALE
jgi:predicted nuclease of predicted toxin-antitoxin system